MHTDTIFSQLTCITQYPLNFERNKRQTSDGGKLSKFSVPSYICHRSSAAICLTSVLLIVTGKETCFSALKLSFTLHISPHLCKKNSAILHGVCAIIA